MELNYIREFVTLADTGNFLEAAEQLFIAQSSLSKHIKTLEQELDVQLFERTTRKVKLSEYGLIFLPFARQIIALQQQYSSALTEEKNRLAGHLVIGSLSMMVQYGITDLLVNFQNQNPHITISVEEGEGRYLKEQMRQGKCDLAFLRDDNHDDSEFDKMLFWEDRVVAVLPRRHHLAKAPHIFMEQLCDENFLMLPEYTLVHSFALQLCHKAGFEPNVILTVRKGESLIDLVGKGMGIALLMRRPAMYQGNPQVTMVDIHPIIPTNVYLARPRSAPLSPAGMKFLQYIRDTVDHREK